MEKKKKKKKVDGIILVIWLPDLIKFNKLIGYVKISRTLIHWTSIIRTEHKIYKYIIICKSW